MRRLLAVLGLTLAAALLPATAVDAKLSTSRTAIVDGQGRAVELRGFNVIPVWASSPGSTWGADHLRRIRAQGLNTVRYVLYWSDFEPRPGQFDARHLATLDRAIALARDAGLHVVLDPVHIYKGHRYVPAWARTGDVVRSVHRHAHRYLRALARRYAHEPAVVAYDLVNEPPTWPLDHRRILKMYDALMGTVRAVDRRTILMFQPSYGDASMAGADLRRVRRHRRVVFTLHDYYAGGAGTGYRPTGEQDQRASYAWKGDGYDRAHRGDLADHLQVNLRVMRRAGIPVWVGEFGMDPRARGANAWVRDKIALFRRHGVGWTWWLYGNDGSMGVLDARLQLRPFAALLR